MKTASVSALQGLFARRFLRAADAVPPSLLEAAVEYRLRDHNLLPAEESRIRRRTGR
jgi:hypothetical protein